MEASGTPPCAHCGQPVFPGEPEPAQVFTPAEEDAEPQAMIVHARCAEDFRRARPNINPS